MTEGEIEKSLRQLHIMFIKGETIKPKLFEGGNTSKPLLVVLMSEYKIRFIKRSWQSYRPQSVACRHRRLFGENVHAPSCVAFTSTTLQGLC